MRERRFKLYERKKIWTPWSAVCPSYQAVLWLLNQANIILSGKDVETLPFIRRQNNLNNHLERIDDWDWCRAKFCLILWSNHLLIDFFDQNLLLDFNSSRQNWLKRVWIIWKCSNLIDFNQKEIKNDQFILKKSNYKDFFYINQQFRFFNWYFWSFNWLRLIF